MKKYLELLKHVIKNGDPHEDRTGVGTTSVFGYDYRVDLREGFPLLTTKKMFMRGIVEELRWILAGRTDNQWLEERGVKIWREWSTKEQCARFGRAAGDLGPVYGHLWRAFGQEYNGPRGWPIRTTDPDGRERDSSSGALIEYGPQGDQIRALISELQKNPGSRRLIVSGWDPRVAARVALPPCHTLFHCKVTQKDGDQLLDLKLYQRSADSFLGVPFNIASYALLLELLATVTGMTARNFIHSIGDLHIYRNHEVQVKEQLSRCPFELPRIVIDRRLHGGGFDALLDFKFEDITLVGYQCHLAIKGDVAV